MRPGGTNPLDARGLRRGSQAPYPYDAYPALPQLVLGEAEFGRVGIKRIDGDINSAYDIARKN